MEVHSPYLEFSQISSHPKDNVYKTEKNLDILNEGIYKLNNVYIIYDNIYKLNK